MHNIISYDYLHVLYQIITTCTDNMYWLPIIKQEMRVVNTLDKLLSVTIYEQ